MRKSIDSLAILVQESFQLDPFSNSVFVFCNKRRTTIKVLYWETAGFWLCLYRLEQGRFTWPDDPNDTVAVSYREFRWLLDGLPIEQKYAHRPVRKRLII